MTRVAWIGLGVMGFPMAGHLAKRGGFDVTVYNRTAAKAARWVEAYGGRALFQLQARGTRPRRRARQQRVQMLFSPVWATMTTSDRWPLDRKAPSRP